MLNSLSEFGAIPYNQARGYVQHGIFTGFIAVKDAGQPGNWLLVMTKTNGEPSVLNNSHNKPKSFASLDSLVKEVERIVGEVKDLTINLEVSITKR